MPHGIKTLLAFFGAIVFILMTFATLIVGLVMEGALASILVALLFAILAAFCIRIGVRKLREGNTPDISGLQQERSRILRLAAGHQGRLTAEEAALGSHIPVDQAQALLDDLVLQGTAETWISDGGTLVYVFRGLLEAEEKQSATDPMAFLDS